MNDKKNEDDPYLTPKSPLVEEKIRSDNKSVTLKTPIKMKLIPLLFSFNGRIGRSQFVIWYLLFSCVPMLLLLTNPMIYSVVYLVCLYPLFSLSIKRTHDLGGKGWVSLLNLVPGIGWVIVLAECGIPIGNFQDNRYGKSIYRKH